MKLTGNPLVAPTLRADGSCPLCGGHGHCAYHSAEVDRKSREFWQSMRSRLAVARTAELSRIAARFEFESDQMLTWREKAELYERTGYVSARY